MVALVRSCTLAGIDAVPVDVECETARGLPGYHVVGLAATSVKEGGARIRSALAAVGLAVPLRRVTVNLAPADLRKPGCALDLPIALAMLIADATCSGEAIDRLLVLGELGLDGSVRAVHGVLAAAILAREHKLRGVIVPDACAAEALVVEGIEVYGVAHLKQVIAAMGGAAPLPVPSRAGPRRPRAPAIDMADVRGQELARFALELAVAGGHNVLLAGPPGAGKTMLAQRIPSILPAMTRAEALATTQVYSALGFADGLIEQRPFRAPHHTISTAALTGGGSTPRPGELSLAHNGVLFLDELPEFQRAAIEALRQPLEDRVVTISRVAGTLKMPASFLLAAAANPCPCGWLGSGMRECTCGGGAIERYRARLSGPLLDRIDLHVTVGPVSLRELRRGEPAEASAAIRDRVTAARQRQRARLARWKLHCNAEMTSSVLRASCRLDDAAERELARVVGAAAAGGAGAMSARAIDRLIRVARTLADLADREAIDAGCIREAAALRAIEAPAEPVPMSPPPALEPRTQP